MKLQEVDDLLDEYARWVRDNLRATQQGESVRIVGPMLDRHNDFMSVILSSSDDGDYVLTDMGDTIGDLSLCGCDVMSSASRREKMDTTLATFGVKRTDQELYVRTSRDELVLRLNMLFQAMASIDDLFYTARESVRNLFTEDVSEWLFANDIHTLNDVSFTGKSGLLYKFNYAIPQTKRYPERLIKAVNDPSRSGIIDALFGWQDVEQSRERSRGYLILNAMGTKEREIDVSSLAACENYGIQPIRWGIDQDRFVPELAA